MNYSDPQKRPRLHYLDGIRGLAALTVAIYHAQLFNGHFISTEQLWPVLQPLSKVLSFGYLAVPLFIVLSGYCLAIPVIIDDKKELRGGFKTYIGRRANRILPPYYFALALFIIMILCIPVLQKPAQTAWDSKIPISITAILAHLFLVHNLNNQWVYKIDGPLWSVATEWQLYFLFPVLLYLWRRFNLIIVTIVCVIATIAVSKFIVPAKVMHLWFLGLFAVGVMGANISFSLHPSIVKLRALNWRIVANVTLLLIVVILIISDFINLGFAVLETVVGLAACVLIINYSKNETEQKPQPAFQRFLDKPTLIYLGAFSYSIYLIHSPFLALMNLLALKVHLEPSLRWLYMEFVALPLAVGISYIFYLLVEKHFILSPSQKKLKA